MARDYDITLTVETHNFPCGIAPFPGQQSPLVQRRRRGRNGQRKKGAGGLGLKGGRGGFEACSSVALDLLGRGLKWMGILRWIKD